VVGAAAVSMGFFDVDCLGRTAAKGCLQPSEWGDVLAGVFSPLAFFWLVYTARNQRRELELQRNELALQRRELEQNNRSQAEQAIALQSQVRRLDAQADASFEPFFICSDYRLDTGVNAALLVIRVMNLSDVPLLNVTTDCEFTIYGSSVADRPLAILSYWPKKAHIEFAREPEEISDAAENQHFEISFTRLDLTRVTHSYRLVAAERRLELLRRVVVSTTESGN
jgi:hypothetical protein